MQTSRRSKFLANIAPTCLKISQQQKLLLMPSLIKHLHSTTACLPSIHLLLLQSLRHHRQRQQTKKEQKIQIAQYQQKSTLLSTVLPTLSVLRRSYSKFSSSATTLLNEERANDLIVNLTDSERDAVKKAIIMYEARIMKEGYETKLAGSKWRTRFGRTPTLGDVDPTGSYCPFPEDWLKKKAVGIAKRPSNADLTKIFIVNAVPFVAFGFLDNFIMIVAGDYIEDVFDSTLCLSTMAAAGLGNTFSDVIGIGSAYYVERSCDILGLRNPELSPAQMELSCSRYAGSMGRIIGITIGCLLGMVPLLFMDSTRINEFGEKEKVSSIYARK